MKPRLLLFNLLTDADDPVLGFTTLWLNAIAGRCQQVDVITMQIGRLDVADNVQVYSVGKEKGYSEPRRALEFYRILFGLLRQNRYDACFAHMMPLFALMAAPLLKIAHIPTTLWHAHKAVSTILRLAEKTVDHVVTPSPESFRLPSRKTHLIGHGVDTDLFTPSVTPRPVDRPFTIISAGRIAPVKRLESIIEAVKLLVDATGKPDIRLRLVGNVYPQDADYANHLRDLVTKYGLNNIVEFPGGIVYSEVAREYQQADVMVNLSATGSIDKAVLEAMACGLPVVTANEAFQSILAPWKDSFLIPPDAPDELAIRLRRLMEVSPEERNALGLQLRAIVVEQHSLNHLVDELMAILVTTA